jgi:hypothetical protein
LIISKFESFTNLARVNMNKKKNLQNPSSILSENNY